MKENDFYIKLFKYFSSEITEEEQKALDLYLKEKKYRKLFKEYSILNHNITTVSYNSKSKQEKDFKHILKSSKKAKVFRLSTLFKYAAILIVGLCISLVVYNRMQVGNSNYIEKINEVTLKTNDGRVVVLKDTKSFLSIDETGEVSGNYEENLIDYTKDLDSTQAIVYNELIVPEGRRFNVRLSDSTIVFLNSGTVLKYPSSFKNQFNRQVFIDGEAYFDVAKNANKPFIVQTEDVTIQVLGTKFNIRSYSNNKKIKTALVEGSVNLYLNDLPENQKTLIPGQAAVVDEIKKHINVESFQEDNEIGWIFNRLVFIDEPFYEVVKKIERSYGVKIVNKNESLNSVHFYGDFDIQNESVEDVLKAFTTIQFFEYARNKENEIIIKK